jgi:hypothetical protein
MNNSEALAEAIKNMEPALRAKGQAPSWSRFNVQFQDGQYSEPVLVPKAVENSAGDVLDWFKKESE